MKSQKSDLQIVIVWNTIQLVKKKKNTQGPTVRITLYLVVLPRLQPTVYLPYSLDFLTACVKTVKVIVAPSVHEDDEASNTEKLSITLRPYPNDVYDFWQEYTNQLQIRRCGYWIRCAGPWGHLRRWHYLTSSSEQLNAELVWALMLPQEEHVRYGSPFFTSWLELFYWMSTQCSLRSEHRIITHIDVIHW